MNRGVRKAGVVLVVIVLLSLFAAPVAGDIIINEFLANGANDPNTEWVELYNNGGQAVNIEGWNLTDYQVNFSLPKITIRPGTFVLLVRDSAQFNASFTSSLLFNASVIMAGYGAAAPSLQLANLGDNLLLYDGDLLISNATYNSSTTGVSEGRMPDGVEANRSAFSRPTPGTKNDNRAPLLNAWVNPVNHSILRGALNVVANVTDEIYAVNATRVEFRNSTISSAQTLSQSGDFWSAVVVTSGLNDGVYTVALTTNDTAGLNVTHFKTNVTIDNTAPTLAYNLSTPANQSTVVGVQVINISAEDALTGVQTLSIFVDGNAVKNCTGVGLSGRINCTFEWNSELFGHTLHRINATVNDTAGNERSLGTRDVSVFDGHGTTNNITLHTPTPGGNISGIVILNITGSNHTKNVTWGFRNATHFFNVSNATTDNNGAAAGNESWRLQFNTSLLNDGTYNISGFVVNQTDHLNQTSQADVRVDNTAPSITYSLPTPVNGANVTGTQVINVTAADGTTMVGEVTIYIDGHAVKNCSSGDSPGTVGCGFSWNTVSFSGKGVHTFNATVNDSLNNRVSLATFSVVVFNPLGNNLLLNAPANGTNISGAFLLNATTANASKNVTWSLRNLTGVTNFSNASGVLLNESWRFQLNSSQINDGGYVVTVATINQDNRFNQSSEGNAPFILVDNTAPTLTYNLSTPSNGTVVSGVRFINVTAEDATTMVGEITIFVDGNAVKNCTSADGPGKINCTFEWNSEEFGHSVHTILASVNDSLNNRRNLTSLEIGVFDGHGTTNNISLHTPAPGGNISGIVVLNITGSNHTKNVTWGFRNATHFFNVSNATTDNNGAAAGNESWRLQFNTSLLNDGTYNISGFVVNQTDHLNQTSVASVQIDNLAPILTYNLSTPTNQSTVVGVQVINITAEDAITGVDKLSIFIDGNAVKNCTGAGLSGRVNCTFEWNSEAFGHDLHRVNATVRDFAGNENTLGTRDIRVFDGHGTTNSIFAVIPQQGVNLTGVVFLNLTGSNHTLNATWSLINTTQVTNFSNATPDNIGSFSGNTSWQFRLDTRTLNDGIYNVSQGVFNQTGHFNQTSQADVRVDNTPPVLVFNLSTPANATSISGLQVINVTGEDALTMVSVLTILLNNDAVKNCSSEDSPGKINCTFSWNLQDFPGGNHFFSATANDSLGNRKTLEARNITIVPFVTNNLSLLAPQNGTNISGISRLNATAGNQSVNITWLFENVTGLFNFSNATTDNNGATFGNESWRFQLDTTKLNDGAYNVTVSVFDQRGRLNRTAENNASRILVDNTAPTIVYNLSTPSNGTVVSGVRFINVTAEDATTMVGEITIFVDGNAVKNCTSADIPGKINCTFEWNSEAFGHSSHMFNATVSDSLGNRRTLGALNVTVFDGHGTTNNISLKNPTNNSKISGVVVLNVTASNHSRNVTWSFVNATHYLNFSNVSTDHNGTSFGNESWRLQINTSLFNDGEYLVVASVINQTGHMNQTGENATLVRVDNALPPITFIGCSPSQINLTDRVVCNATVTDPGSGLSVVLADVVFPNRSNMNQTLVTNGNNRGFTFNATVRGVYNVTFFANDTLKSTNFIIRQFTVQNRAPQLNKTLSNQQFNEDTNLTINISQFIADPENDTLNVTAIGLTSNISVFINITTGNVTFQPAANFSGINNVVFFVHDGIGGNVTSNNISLTAIGINDEGPQLSAFPTLAFKEDTSNKSINLSDFVKDDDTADHLITWTKSGDSNILFTVLPGELANFSATPHFCGTTAVVLRASDGVTGMDAPIKVVIDCVQDTPLVEQVSPADQSVVNQTQVTLKWNGTDRDNEILTFSVHFGTTANPDLNVTTKETNLTLTGLSNNVIYFWRVNATDGVEKVSSSVRQFTVTTNLQPVISSFNPTSTTPSIEEGKEQSFDITARDPENGNLTFHWTLDGTSVRKSLFNSTGQGVKDTFVYKTGFDDSGTHDMQVTVTDNGTLSVTQKWVVTVTEQNSPPDILGTIPLQTLVEDSGGIKLDLTSFESDKEDKDSGLTWKVSDVDANLFVISISSVTDDATITPVKDAFGTDAVVFTLFDSGGKNDSQQVVINVTPVNDAPVITSFSPLPKSVKMGENTTKVFNLASVDVDGTTPTFTWYVNSVQSGSGRTFTYTGSALGTFTVKGEAHDGTLSASESWTVSVEKNPSLNSFDGPSSFEVEILNDTDLADVENFTLQRSGQARIEFVQDVDLRDIVDIDNLVITGNNLVGIDGREAAGMNRPARVTLFGVNLNNPVILFSDAFTSNQSAVTTPCTFCRVVNTSGGQVVFETSHFTTFTASSSIAAELDVPSSVTFGSVERNATVQTNFIIRNKGNLESLTDVLVTGKTDSKYNLQFGIGGSLSSSLNLGSLAPGAEQKIIVQISVPNGENTGEHDVADIIVSSLQSTKTISSVLIDPASSLRIVNVEIDGDDLSDGGRADISPDSSIDVEVEVENSLKLLDMEDVEIEVTLFDIDGNDDLEKSTKEFDIRTGDKEKETLTFKIPEDLDEDSYDIRVEVTGDDEQGGRHTAVLRGTLDVEKEKHKLVLDASLSSSEVSCDRNPSVLVEVKNLGESDEEDVAVSVDSGVLEIHEETRGVDIDENDEYRTNFALAVARAEPGSYAIGVRVLRDGELEDSASLPLRVSPCREIRGAEGDVREQDVRSQHEKLFAQLLAEQQAQRVTVEQKSEFVLSPVAVVMGLIAFNLIVFVLVIGLATRRKKIRGKIQWGAPPVVREELTKGRGRTK